jgi:hypothetical protein
LSRILFDMANSEAEYFKDNEQSKPLGAETKKVRARCD